MCFLYTGSRGKDLLLKKIIGFLFVVLIGFVSVDIYAAGVDLCDSQLVPSCCWEADVGYECSLSCPSWQDDRVCYVEIPIEIGQGANFNGKTAGADGVVKEKMYYKDYACDTGTVFAHDDDNYQVWGFCTDYYEWNGQYKPTRSGYSFSHWELYDTCSGGDPIAYKNTETDLVPVWEGSGPEDSEVCKKIRAVWCSDAGHEVLNGNGECVCKRGYYMDGTECKKCEDGFSTLEPGATSQDDCVNMFQYGTNEYWTWPDTVKPGEIKNIKP